MSRPARVVIPIMIAAFLTFSRVVIGPSGAFSTKATAPVVECAVRPRPYAGRLLVEEKAEGGDVLAETIRAHPRFLEGFSRVSEGAGVALYQRDPGAFTSPSTSSSDDELD